MSEDSQSFAAVFQLNNYMSITIPAVIMFDYIITLPNEINYIWSQSWTWISVLFVVVRYVGIFIAVIQGLYGSSFIPVSKPVYVQMHPFISTACPQLVYLLNRCTALIITVAWAFVVFLAAADMIMILRVYAMYRRSKTVLAVLLLFYIPTIVLLAVSTGYYENPRTHLLVTTPQALGTSFCSATWTSLSKFNSYTFIPRFILSGLMFVLALARFLLASFRTYKAINQWLSSRYINLLVREGTLYFFVNLLYSIDSDVITAQVNQLSLQAMLMNTFSLILLFVFCPRFILSVRELYAVDTLTCWRRPGDVGIDTGFGVMGSSDITNDDPIRFAYTVEDAVLENESMSAREMQAL